MRILSGALLLSAGIVLAACGGSKDEVKAQGNGSGTFGDAGQGQGGGGGGSGGGGGNDGVPDRRSYVQITCESNTPTQQKLVFTHSLRRGGEPSPDILVPPSGKSYVAPAFASVRGGMAQLVVVSDGRSKLVRFDLGLHQADGEAVSLARAPRATSSVYRRLGFTQARVATRSPDGQTILLTETDGVSLRSAEDPTRVFAKWKSGAGVYQARWGSGNEVFVDVPGSGLGQAALYLGADGRSFARTLTLPKSSGAQIGLRRFDEDSLVWLEWSDRGATIRLWNQKTDKKSAYPLPARAKLGPGFALYRASADASPLVVMNSRSGFHFYGLTLGGAQETFVPYPAFVLEELARRNGEPGDIIDLPRAEGWSPGAIYSAAADTQLFTVLPHPFGDLLFAFDATGTLRDLGYEKCNNPDFLLMEN